MLPSSRDSFAVGREFHESEGDTRMRRQSFAAKGLAIVLAVFMGLGPVQFIQVDEAAAQSLADGLQTLAAATALMQQNNQTAQQNQQLLQQLSGQEAQQIATQIQIAQMKLRTELTNMLSCLQRSSVANSGMRSGFSGVGSSAAGGGTGTPRGIPTTLGRNQCQNPNADLSIYENERDITCTNAERAETMATRDRTYNQCRKNQLELLLGVVACVDGFDGKLQNAVSDIQKLITQRADFMKKVISNFNQSVQGHERSIEIITQELEGEGGYKDQVNKLEGLLNALNDSLSAPAGTAERTGQTIDFEGQPLEAGIAERVRHLSETEEANLTDSWFKTMLGGTQGCFENDLTECDATGARRGIDCLKVVACSNLTRGSGFTARCNQNQAALERALGHIRTKYQFNIQLYGPSLNPYDPQSVVNAASQEKNRLLALIMSSFDDIASSGTQQGFVGGGNVSGLKAKAQSMFDRCFNRQVSTFSQSFSTASVSQNNPFKQGLENLRRKELEVTGDLERWMRTVAGRMTTFRTKFTSVFSNSLLQFKEDCVNASPSSATNPGGARSRPRQMLACLQSLKTRLEGGLNGTNGEPPTAIQIPVINGTPGAQGTTSSFITQSCSGFKDCIQQLDVARKTHGQQKDNLIGQRRAQSQQHNQTIDSILSEASTRFNAALSGPGGLQQLLTQINGLLGGNGITKRINPETRDTEALEKDEGSSDDAESRIYKNPTNILNALSGRSPIMRITQENIAEIREEIQEKLRGSGGRNSDGINPRIEKAGRILGQARDRIRACTPNESEYSAIRGVLGRCENLRTICDRGLASAVSQIEVIAGKVSTDPANSTNPGLYRDQRTASSYARCISSSNGVVEGLSPSERAMYMQSRRDQPQRQRSAMERISEEMECLSEAMNQARTMATNSREEFRGRHNEVLARLDELIGACEEYRPAAATAAVAAERASAAAERRIASVDTECVNREVHPRVTNALSQLNTAISRSQNIRPPDTAFTNADERTAARQGLTAALNGMKDWYRSQTLGQGSGFSEADRPDTILRPAISSAQAERLIGFISDSALASRFRAAAFASNGEIRPDFVAFMERVWNAMGGAGGADLTRVSGPLEEAIRSRQSCEAAATRAEDAAQGLATRQDRRRTAIDGQFSQVEDACRAVVSEVDRLAAQARAGRAERTPGSATFDAFEGN